MPPNRIGLSKCKIRKFSTYSEGLDADDNPVEVYNTVMIAGDKESNIAIEGGWAGDGSDPSVGRKHAGQDDEVSLPKKLGIFLLLLFIFL